MKLHKNTFKVLTILVSSLLLVYVISGMRLSDAVALESGGEQVGRIVEQTRDRVVLETKSGERTVILADRIKKDKKGELEIARGLWTVLAQSRPGWFVVAIVLFGLPPVSGAVRWRMLLATQNVRLTFYESCSLTFIGYLFNYIMLGLTGGDVVKAYYVSRQTQRKTAAVLSVFMDRLIGLIALALLAMGILLLNLGDKRFGDVVVPVVVFAIMAVFGVLVLLSRRLRRKLPQTVVVVAAVGGTALLMGRAITLGLGAVRYEILVFALVILAAGIMVLTPLSRFLRWEALKHKLGSYRIVREIDGCFHVYRAHPWVLSLAFTMSFIIHCLNIVGVYACGRALGVGLGLTSYMLLVPVILMISSIPVSVAGLGVQETMFQLFFGLPGIGLSLNVASMLAFLFRILGSFIWVIPGYLFLVLWRDRPSLEAVQESMMETEPSESTGQLDEGAGSDGRSG